MSSQRNTQGKENTRKKGGVTPKPPTRQREPTEKQAAALADAQAPPKANTHAAKDAELEKYRAQVQVLQDNLEQEKQSKAGLQKKLDDAKKAKKAAKAMEGSIPKPRGDAGVQTKERNGRTYYGYNLQEAMGLDGDRDSDEHKLFKAIQRAVRDHAEAAGINRQATYKYQDPGRLGDLFRHINTLFPITRNFVNNWAIADMVRSQLQNRVGYSVKMDYIPHVDERPEKTGKKRTAPDSDIDHAAKRAHIHISSKGSKKSASKGKGKTSKRDKIMRIKKEKVDAAARDGSVSASESDGTQRDQSDDGKDSESEPEK